MAFLLVYIGIGICSWYGFAKYFGNYDPVDLILETITWPASFLDKELRECMYSGWSK